MHILVLCCHFLPTNRFFNVFFTRLNEQTKHTYINAHLSHLHYCYLFLLTIPLKTFLPLPSQLYSTTSFQLKPLLHLLHKAQWFLINLTILSFHLKHSLMCPTNHTSIHSTLLVSLPLSDLLDRGHSRSNFP